MKKSGVNVEVYKSHSTRMATASKVLELGVSINDVMRAER